MGVSCNGVRAGTGVVAPSVECNTGDSMAYGVSESVMVDGRGRTGGSVDT